MAVIDLPDPAQFDQVLESLHERVRAYTKAPAATSYVRAAALYPPYLAHLGDEGLGVMVSRQLPRKTKEMIAVGVSMTNGCEYCIRAHTTVLKKMFKVSDGEIVELAAVTAHANGQAALAAALQIDPDGTVAGPFQPVGEDGDPLLAEIREALGEVPVHYRVLARDPQFLKLHWQRERGILLGGAIDRPVKHLVSLGVAASRGARYLVAWHGAAARRLGVTEDQLFEALMVIDAFNKNNAFTEGLQLELGVWGQDGGPPAAR